MKHSNSKYTLKETLKFIIPSFIGILLFMIPISQEGSITIPIALLSKGLQNILAGAMIPILFILISTSAILTVITKIFKPKWILNQPFLNSLFNISVLWTSIRTLAFIFVTVIMLTQMQVNLPAFLQPLVQMVTSADTGTFVMTELLPVLFSIFLFAGLFLPLLLNFGLLEFIGALLVKVMRPIFGLPGRSAIDCIASWLGDGTIGVLLTSKQYEEGFYTEREAVVIGTTFSLVSITFSLVVIDTVGLSHMFIPFYLTVTFASLFAAIVMPKLPPLSKRKDVLFDGSIPNRQEEDHSGTSHLKEGYGLALKKAAAQNAADCILKDGFKNVIDMWLCVIPVVMAIGTTALILANYTPLFEILGLPFLPVLKVLGIPEAAAASQTLVAGFADMLLPAVMAAQIQSDLTRFVIASVSVCQLIYLSEVGALLLGSKIPVTLKDLFIIFIERTLITLPVISIIAHLLF